MQTVANGLRREGNIIGFVPTMGFLHEGHLSLMRRMRKQAEILIISLFVNPAQFGPNEDFDAYPRDFAHDETRCREVGVDLLFCPTPATMYLDEHSVWIDEESLSGVLCGLTRPEHFRGVCTVVAKLLNLVLPDFMMLGEKDAQQLRILRRMVRDLNFPTKILSGPTVREADGLAMSSRNKYLSPEERAEANCLFRALQTAETLFASGERNAENIKAAVRSIIEKTSGNPDYIELVDDETLRSIQILKLPALLTLAVRFSSTRLIDHTLLSNLSFQKSS